MIIFIVPKNSGLAITKELSKEFLGELIEVRGEDVPLFVSNLISNKKKAIGITGEDLFREYQLKNNLSNLKIVRKVEWLDNSFIFKKPALCLLGPKDKQIQDLPKKRVICINKKYQEIAKKYCTNLLENKGYNIQKVYLSGATEEFYSKGLATLIIDIVCSGKSAETANLKVYDKLIESDIVILGAKNGI